MRTSVLKIIAATLILTNTLFSSHQSNAFMGGFYWMSSQQVSAFYRATWRPLTWAIGSVAEWPLLLRFIPGIHFLVGAGSVSLMATLYGTVFIMLEKSPENGAHIILPHLNCKDPELGNALKLSPEECNAYEQRVDEWNIFAETEPAKFATHPLFIKCGAENAPSNCEDELIKLFDRSWDNFYKDWSVYQRSAVAKVLDHASTPFQ